MHSNDRKSGYRLGFAATVFLLFMIGGLLANEEQLKQTGALNTAQSWLYQLQRIEPAEIAATDADLAVIDRLAEGDLGPFSAAEVELMQRAKSGKRRPVFAYISIGEAEQYREYWNDEWTLVPPAWLGDENPDWQGNFAVRYWDPAWQSLIFGQASAYLDLVLDAGFDGAYLDRVDAFDLPDTMLPRRQRMRLMSDFVARLADYARKKRPGFLILGQNAEELLADPVYAAAIDGVAKEDLFFGLEGDAVANAKAEIRESLRALLDFRRQSGKPIFLVEYLSDPSDILLAQSYARQMDAPLFIADRELDDATSR